MDGNPARPHAKAFRLPPMIAEALRPVRSVMARLSPHRAMTDACGLGISNPDRAFPTKLLNASSLSRDKGLRLARLSVPREALEIDDRRAA